MTVRAAIRSAAPSVRSMGLALAALVAATAWQVAPAAHAQTPSVSEVVVHGTTHRGREVRQEKVSYADLNLHSTAGAWAVLRRVRAAAKRVCAPRPADADLDQLADYKTCLHDAVANAVAELGNPRVSALYGKKS